MQDLKPGTEVVHHHGKQTESQALSHFHDELKDLRQQMSGHDGSVTKNLSHYNFRKLDEALHKPHNGAPAELDKHLHASAVYEFKGKMQLVFTDDLYNSKAKDHTKHAYTINEKTGKIDAEFHIRETKTHEKVLVKHTEHNENQTPLATVNSGDASAKKGSNYTEYQTTTRTTGDYSKTTYPDGHRVERDGIEGGASTNIVRITEQNGKSARLTWDGNRDTPQTVTFTGPEQNRYELTKAPGFTGNDMYQSSDGLYWKVNVDKKKGTIDYHQATAKEIDDKKIQPPSNYRYEA
jgi:hypothetical protein